MRLFVSILMILAPLTSNAEAPTPLPIEVYFRPVDVTLITRSSYASTLASPVTQKLTRNSTLPPGWEKHYRPFPYSIESKLPPICKTCARGYYDDYAIVFDKQTTIIYDLTQLFLRPAPTAANSIR